MHGLMYVEQWTLSVQCYIYIYFYVFSRPSMTKKHVAIYTAAQSYIMEMSIVPSTTQSGKQVCTGKYYTST